MSMIQKCRQCGEVKPIDDFNFRKNRSKHDTKICPKCKKEKTIDLFYKSNRSKDGLRSWCKQCGDTSTRKYQTNNKDNVRKKQYEYNALHKDEIKVYRREYQVRQRKENSLFKVRHNLTKLIGTSLNHQGYTKKSKIYRLLGCDYEHAKNWLEYTWFLNYGTEYAGQEVEIDHIIPSSSAKTEEECIVLQHISNLQYLTMADNRRKGCNINWV